MFRHVSAVQVPADVQFVIDVIAVVYRHPRKNQMSLEARRGTENPP